MELRRGGHWWGSPSQWSAASVETDACLAVEWRRRAGSLEELETRDKKKKKEHHMTRLLKSEHYEDLAT